jgi:hypothetical protein
MRCLDCLNQINRLITNHYVGGNFSPREKARIALALRNHSRSLQKETGPCPLLTQT